MRFTSTARTLCWALSAVAGLTAASFAHDDDPKLLDRQLPWLGPDITTGVPAPGSRAPLNGPREFSALNITLLAQVGHGTMSSSAANDCWGYTSPSGREYAIIGLNNGTAWLEITNPNSPVLISKQGGANSTWRDIKVYGTHAYVGTEGSGGNIQVFDMSNIDAGVVTLANTVTLSGGSSSHNVAINEDSGYLYVCGGGSNGLRIYDLNASATNPPFVGSWSTKYVHDAQIVSYTSGPYAGREIAYCCAGFNGGGTNTGLTVVDVTNKAAPVVLDEAFWPNAGYSHQGWLTEDKRYLYVNDELDEPPLPSTTIVFDVLDPANVVYLNSFTNGNPAITHNNYVKGDLLFAANYRSGMRVFDLAVSKTSPPEAGFYDTYPADDNAQFNSLWSVYPFFPSGVVIGSDIENGLWVWQVGDPPLDITLVGGPPAFLNPAGDSLPVTIVENPPGTLVPGTAMLNYDAGAGFVSVPLQNQGGGNWSAVFPAIPCGTAVSFNITAQSNTGPTFSAPLGGGFYSTITATGLATVIDDNFESNLGWTTSFTASSGQWERGVPVNDPGWQYDPMSDSDGSGQCYLTQNAPGNTDVDNGSVTLVSPVMDMSAGGVTISYDYYLYLSNDNGVDKMQVDISSNGGAGPWTPVATHDVNGNTSWRSHQITQAALNGAGVTLTANMQMRFVVNDDNPQSIVESGLDAFKVTSVNCSGCTGSVASFCTAKAGLACGIPAISTSGTPSATAGSGFTISAGPARTCKSGILVYNTAQGIATPFEGGTLCVEAMGLRRAGSTNSMGTPGGANCDGAFSIDMNAFAVGAWIVPDCAGAPSAFPASNPAGFLTNSGTTVYTQWWGRDSVATGSFVSDGASYTVCP